MVQRAQVEECLRLYAVTDRAWLDGRTLPGCVASAIAGGVTCVQLREKHMRGSELDELALTLKNLCAEAGIPFLVNDDVGCALRVGADGVHVGQDDMDCAAVRRLLGPDAMVGVSVRTLEEARAAEAAGADYLGVGALFGTPTKPESAEMGIEALRGICDNAKIPVVAIGGLNEKTIPALQGTGVSGVAVVSALFAPDDIEAAAQRLKACVEKVLPY